MAIRLDLEAITKLQLDVDAYSVARAIAGAKLHLKMESVLCGPPNLAPYTLKPNPQP